MASSIQKNVTKNEIKKTHPLSSIENVLISVYLVFMFVAFPFFLTYYYGHARTDKFWFFVVTTCVFALALCLVHFIKPYISKSKVTVRIKSKRNKKTVFKVCFWTISILIIGLFNWFCFRFLINIFDDFHFVKDAKATSNAWFVKLSYFFSYILTAVISAVLLHKIYDFVMKNKEKAKYNVFNLNATDIGILLFLLFNVISTIVAVNNEQQFLNVWLANDARNIGLLMVFVLTIAYFIVSRYFHCDSYVFLFMLIGMGLMSWLAVVNYYYFDPLGIFKAYKGSARVIKDFTSTIGNKNFLSAMICIALPFSVGVSVATKDLIIRIVSYVSVALQFAALIVATSDGGFLGCFFGLAALFLVCSRDLKKLFYFFISCAVMISGAKLLFCFDLIMSGNNKGYHSFSKFFIYNNYLFFLIPLFIGLAVVCYYLKDNKKEYSKITFGIAISILTIIFIAVIILFNYFTVQNPEAEVNELTSFFRYNDDWGTHRGFFWNRSFIIFENSDWIQKLFGTGPDAFNDAFSVYNGELYASYGESYTTAAHNVYINYLITVGMTGAVAYLLFVLSSVVNTFKNAFTNNLALACIGPICAFVFQDIVNIANPINTPWLIIFIAIGQAARLPANSQERLNKNL